MTHLGSVANTGEVDGFEFGHKRFVVRITFADLAICECDSVPFAPVTTSL